MAQEFRIDSSRQNIPRGKIRHAHEADGEHTVTAEVARAHLPAKQDLLHERYPNTVKNTNSSYRLAPRVAQDLRAEELYGTIIHSFRSN